MDKQKNSPVANENYKERRNIYYWRLLQKCVYFGCWSLVLVSLILILSHGTKLYLEYPIYTETTIVPQQNSPFPSVSLCSIPNGYKEDILKVNFYKKSIRVCMEIKSF